MKPAALHRLAAGLALGAVCLLLSGCVQMRQELVLNADNTGKFSIRISAPRQRVHDIVLRDGAPLADLAPIFTPGQIDTLFPAADGFKVDGHTVAAEGEVQFSQITGTITDLEKAIASGRLGDFSLTRADGKTRLQLKSDYLLGVYPEAAGSARGTRLRELLTGLRLELLVRAPADLRETSAPTSKGAVAAWTFDLEKNDDFLDKTPDIHLVW